MITTYYMIKKDLIQLWGETNTGLYLGSAIFAAIEVVTEIGVALYLFT